MSDSAERKTWPVLRQYDPAHLRRIAMPMGGIGTGTVSLGGRGDLRDWEVMNRPAKGFVPKGQPNGAFPFFALNVQLPDGSSLTRVLEGPLEVDDYEGESGSSMPNHGLPRFSTASFEAAYPLAQVHLADQAVPVTACLQAFNPLVPADVAASSVPVAVLRYVLTNRGNEPLSVSVCGSLPNFIGVDGSQTGLFFSGTRLPVGAKANRNQFHQGKGMQGVFMKSEGVDLRSTAWGTLALVTTAQAGVSYRTNWATHTGGWGNDLLGFWDDFSADGILTDCTPDESDMPMASLAVKLELPAQATREVTFVLAWHFPVRCTWTPLQDCECQNGVCCEADAIGNYYTTQYLDAWDVAEHFVARMAELEAKTVSFVGAFCAGDLPDVVKEAALFNLSTLRSQTCFRTADGLFYGWEGCFNSAGCCHGSCTHVWNYEQATAFLFGDLSKILRRVEFGRATREDDGLMSFRVNLPIERALDFGKAAADGQMGCILKMYRDWQLSGDEALLRELWPNVKQALTFCWVQGGWDGDRDGVMEGCQHNTMDVEYFGPNPQMETWYLGALRAGEEMARSVGEVDFAATCRDLFEKGSAWTDAHLFNGEYYEHEVRPARSPEEIYPGLMVGMGARNLAHPDYQLGPGCLVDQLVGQTMAHVCGLGYLLDAGHVKTALQSILKYNHRDSFRDHFNCMRSYVLGDESALLMASYPHERPEHPFPYFSEVMTGFEYTAAVGMLYEGMEAEGVSSIRDIRDRYDGRKRSPFDEAECGHHYARAMASWGAVLALSGFHYSAVDGHMTFAAKAGSFFWSTGYAWGTVKIERSQEAFGKAFSVQLSAFGGQVKLARLSLDGVGEHAFEQTVNLSAGQRVEIQI